ncbi:MAG TPA: hypothetical protein PL165_07620 [Methanofastidiosum sp.]|nr:hypothetical protein [Methanofastidiosum sp.]
MKLYKKISYKLFKRWQQKTLISCIKRYPTSDYEGFLRLLICKLTVTGIEYKKWAPFLEFTFKKEAIRSLWRARFYLKQSLNSFDTAYTTAQRAFLAKYGVPYIPGNLIIKDLGNGYQEFLGWELQSPPCKEFYQAKKITNDFYSMLPDEYVLRDTALRKAMQIIQQSVFSWWF